uniref:Uncharacterized protein n=1 Tax=Caenorhabditis japonica TaxID=281687 RepID=A0A8R1E974_CAEJA
MRVYCRPAGAAPNPKRPNPKWYESALRPNPKPPEFEVVRMRGAQIRNARVRSGTNPKWYGSEAPKLETPESEVIRNTSDSGTSYSGGFGFGRGADSYHFGFGRFGFGAAPTRHDRLPNAIRQMKRI